MPNNNDPEKRRFIRIPLETHVNFTINNREDVSYSGITQNLCAAGIYLTTHHALKLGNKIKLVLNTGKKPIIVEGHVVRCKFDKTEPDLFHVSVELAQYLNIEDRTLLASRLLLRTSLAKNKLLTYNSARI